MGAGGGGESWHIIFLFEATSLSPPLWNLKREAKRGLLASIPTKTKGKFRHTHTHTPRSTGFFGRPALGRPFFFWEEIIIIIIIIFFFVTLAYMTKEGGRSRGWGRPRGEEGRKGKGRTEIGFWRFE